MYESTRLEIEPLLKKLGVTVSNQDFESKLHNAAGSKGESIAKEILAVMDSSSNTLHTQSSEVFPDAAFISYEFSPYSAAKLMEIFKLLASTSVP
jgi:hypothetical protein